MKRGTLRNIDLWGVVALLGCQALLLWLSLDVFFKIGAFCTGAGSRLLSLFGYVHFAFAALLLLGLVSLARPALRLPYLVAIAVALTALPVQAWLVDHHYLLCDAP